MWGIIFRALNWAGVAALGYFANDIGDGFVNYVPQAKDPNTGKIFWAWMIALLLVVAGLMAWLITIIVPRKYQKT